MVASPIWFAIFGILLYVAAEALGVIPGRKRKGKKKQLAHDQQAQAEAGRVLGVPIRPVKQLPPGVRDVSDLPRLTTQELIDFDFHNTTHDGILSAHRRHGDFFTGNVLGNEALYCRDLKAARFVLTKTPRSFKLDKGVVMDIDDLTDTSGFTPISRNNLLQPMFYGTVFHLEGLAHRKHRRAIANALAARQEPGNAYVREVEKELAQHWVNPDLKEENLDGWVTVDVQKLSYIAMATGAIQVAVGPEFELTPEVRGPLLKGVTEVEYADPGVEVPLIVSGVERDVMLEILAVLKKAVSTMEPSTDKKCALYGMQAGDVDATEIAATLVNFAVAAGESPASGAAHTLATIARLPEVQEKVYDEVQAVCPLEDGLPDALEAPKQLHYMHRVVKESMRHRVPASMVSRVSTEDTILPAAGGHGVAIPAGTRVAVTLSAIHHHDLLFPSPEDFDPDRFLGEKDPAGYVTFSAGPRMCPGERISMMWIQMLVAQVLRRFELRPVPGQDPWDFKHARKFVSWAPGGTLIQVRPRD